jgi:hypothetical protein
MFFERYRLKTHSGHATDPMRQALRQRMPAPRFPTDGLFFAECQQLEHYPRMPIETGAGAISAFLKVRSCFS